jgi:hypothetical protein
MMATDDKWQKKAQEQAFAQAEALKEAVYGLAVITLEGIAETTQRKGILPDAEQVREAAEVMITAQKPRLLFGLLGMDRGGEGAIVFDTLLPDAIKNAETLLQDPEGNKAKIEQARKAAHRPFFSENTRYH